MAGQAKYAALTPETRPCPDFAKIKTISKLREEGRDKLRAASDSDALEKAKAAVDDEKQIAQQLITCVGTACKELLATAASFKGNVATTLKKKKAALASKKKKTEEQKTPGDPVRSKKRKKEAALEAAGETLRNAKVSKWPPCFLPWNAPPPMYKARSTNGKGSMSQLITISQNSHRFVARQHVIPTNSLG